MQDQNPISQVIPKRFAAAAPQAPGRMSQAIFTKNHPKPELPQHMPAARLTSVRPNFFRLLSPCKSSNRRAPFRAPTVREGSRIDCPRATPPPRTISTFRLFDFSTFPPKTTQNPNRPNTCPPQELQTKKIACVTICHLGFTRFFARNLRSEQRMIAANWIDFDVSTFMHRLQHYSTCARAGDPAFTLDTLHPPRPLRASSPGSPPFRRFDFSTFPPKNHPKPEPPQHMPATRVANEKKRVCHLMSPCNSLPPGPRSETKWHTQSPNSHFRPSPHQPPNPRRRHLERLRRLRGPMPGIARRQHPFSQIHRTGFHAKVLPRQPA